MTVHSNCRDWRRTVLQPSFKHVEFEVEGNSETGGRRVQVHEYINREFWDIEDLGKQAATINVRGYVYGDDCNAQAMRLGEALNSWGAGELVLPLAPIYGQPGFMAVCTKWNKSESTVMGVIHFDMDFVLESGAKGGFINAVVLSLSVARSVIEAAQRLADLFSISFDSLKRRLSPSEIVPTPARNAATITIIKAADYLDVARRKVSQGDVIDVAQLEFAARDMRTRAKSLAYAGEIGSRIESDVYVADERVVQAGFAGAWLNAMELLFDIKGAPDAIVDAFLFLTDFAAQTISGTNARSVRAERRLTEDIADMVRRSAAIYWAYALTRKEFVSADDALDARQQAVKLFNSLILNADDIDMQDILSDVRNRVVAFLSDRDEALPKTLLVENDAPMPAALIAAVLYNDASRIEELVNRNLASHPLFMPLKVEALAPLNTSKP